MIFDVYDYEFLRLCGLCRYVPTGLKRKFDVPYFDTSVIATLRSNGYIKMQSNKTSYKLTFEGKEILADMGYTFPDDSRMNINRSAYYRKIKNALWNITLHLAGIDVFFNRTSQLAEINTGYISSLTLRMDENIRVLAGARFLGILKFFDTAYMPYFVAEEKDWIIPRHELEIFKSQISTLPSIRNMEIILIGDTLEELWENIHPKTESISQGWGMTRIDEALKELGCDYSLVPANSDGVIQLSFMKNYRYRERIAKDLGCNVDKVFNLSECDGFKDNIPYIIGLDFNIKRILRALKQIERYDKNIVPKVCCFPFQRKMMIHLLKRYKTQNTTLGMLDIEHYQKNVFKNDVSVFESQTPYIKGGVYLSANQRKITKANIEEL